MTRTSRQKCRFQSLEQLDTAADSGERFFTRTLQHTPVQTPRPSRCLGIRLHTAYPGRASRTRHRTWNIVSIPMSMQQSQCSQPGHSSERHRSNLLLAELISRLVFFLLVVPAAPFAPLAVLVEFLDRIWSLTPLHRLSPLLILSIIVPIGIAERQCIMETRGSAIVIMINLLLLGRRFLPRVSTLETRHAIESTHLVQQWIRVLVLPPCDSGHYPALSPTATSTPAVAKTQTGEQIVLPSSWRPESHDMRSS